MDDYNPFEDPSIGKKYGSRKEVVIIIGQPLDQLDWPKDALLRLNNPQSPLDVVHFSLRTNEDAVNGDDYLINGKTWLKMKSNQSPKK